MKTDIPNPGRGPHRHRAYTLIELLVVSVVICGFICFQVVNRPRSRSSGCRMRCVSNLRQMGLAFKCFADDNEGHYPAGTTVGYLPGKETETWAHFQAMSNELATAKGLLCPSDKVRAESMAENFKLGASADLKSLVNHRNNAVSYFVGANLDESMAAGILAGDRNVAPRRFRRLYSTVQQRGVFAVSPAAEWSEGMGSVLHTNCGNLLLGDGSVIQASDYSLGLQLRFGVSNYGSNAIRFVFPQ